MGTSEQRENEELALVVSDPPVVRDAPAASRVHNVPLGDGPSYDEEGHPDDPDTPREPPVSHHEK